MDLYRALFLSKCTCIWPSLCSNSPSNCSVMSNLLSENYVSDSSFNSYSYSDNNLSQLQLEFTQDELETYTTSRKAGLSTATVPWNNKAVTIFWSPNHGAINKSTMEVSRNFVVTKYQCEYSKGKALNFAKAFLKYLTKTHLDTRYQAFQIFLQKTKSTQRTEERDYTNYHKGRYL